MDARSEIREFLTSRRAKITPEQAGLPWYGENRRVPGLRREEVALLAGVSVDCYTRLERAHLFDLARGAHAGPRTRRGPAKQRVRLSVQRMLDAITGAPAFVRNGRMDILAANRLGRAFYAQHFDSAHGPANSARFIFLDPRATDFYVDWEQVATDAVAILRSEAGRDPYDRGLSDLIGELSTRSDTFRTRWAAHNVRFHDTGVKRFHHPVVGDLELTFETMGLAADAGLMLFVYTAEPGSKSEEALNLLASWAATLDQVEPARVTDG